MSEERERLQASTPWETTCHETPQSSTVFYLQNLKTDTDGERRKEGVASLYHYFKISKEDDDFLSVFQKSPSCSRFLDSQSLSAFCSFRLQRHTGPRFSLTHKNTLPLFPGPRLCHEPLRRCSLLKPAEDRGLADSFCCRELK